MMYTYEELMKKALQKIPNDIDKREGSIIFDALAPSIYELSLMYLELNKIIKETYIRTSVNEFLDYRVEEQNIKRLQETKAIKKAFFENSKNIPIETIPIGARFSTIVTENSLNYKVIDNLGGGFYALECEEYGTAGNNYQGELLPITYINDLKNAIMSDLVEPARDRETDEELRKRYFLNLNVKPSAGNIAYFQVEVGKIAGVGALQVYPIADGGGTTTLSIIDTDYNPITEDFKKILQEKIDPENYSGLGVGITPIGNRITIKTPVEFPIDIAAEIVLKSGYEFNSVQSLVIKNLQDHILELKKLWGEFVSINKYELNVYNSKIISIILNTEGVANVKNVLINKQSEDLTLTQDSALQNLPVVGVITLTS